MDGARSQHTVYRSTASVPGQSITVGFNGAQPAARIGAEYICPLKWLFRGVKSLREGTIWCDRKKRGYKCKRI